MARRSATNARYQKYQEPVGQTRKSAASAKPKRSSSTTPVKSAAKKSGRRVPLAIEPTTAEFRGVRRTWWVLLGAALLLTTASWVLRAYVHTSWAGQAATGVLGLAYGTIFYALYLDWTKMRPMRKAAFQAAKSGKSGKSPNSGKATAEKTITEKVTSERTTTETLTVENSDPK